MNHNKLAVEYVAIDRLKLNHRNPRIHSDKQVRQLAKSIETFGFNVPVVVDAHSRVIAGHGRVLACQHLRIPEVPVCRLEHLTENQIQAFAIADNKLTENAEWDEQLLAVC